MKNINLALLGLLAILVFGASQTLAVSNSEMLLINTNPSGATVSLGYGGPVLGTTPLYIDPRSYSATSPTPHIITKSGYQTKIVAIYSWMVPPNYVSVTYNLKPSSGATAPTPTTDNPPSVSASHTPASPTTSDNVVITASASDDKGLSEITVYADNAAKVTCSVSGTSASCPYGATFAAGTHSYYATAKDNAGKTATASTKQFSVSETAPAPTPAPNNLLTINSNPQGADTWIMYGTYANKYLGKTPFSFDTTLDSKGGIIACGGQGGCWMRFERAGYKQGQAVIFASYKMFSINLNPA